MRLCRTPSSHQELTACIEFANPDLDLRRPEPRRSTIATWVEQCPRCGLCYGDLDRAPPSATEVVETAEYLDILRGASRLPTLARQFWVFSLIAERADMFVTAANQALHAAWACDDANEIDAALRCRARAIRFFELVASDIDAHAYAEPLSSPARHPELWDLQLVDLLRRSHRFDEARGRCQTSQRSRDDNVRAVGRFQLELIDKLDAGSHRVDEALGD